VFLVMRTLVSNVVVLRQGAAKVGKADNGFELLEPGRWESEFEVEAAASSTPISDNPEDCWGFGMAKWDTRRAQFYVRFHDGAVPE
jgi:hypothetical protein